MNVKELMSTGICSVRPEASIYEIARQMRKLDVGAIPVCNDKGEILGIVTDRDIVLRCIASDPPRYTASGIMSGNIISAPEEMNIHDAALLLSRNQVRRLPVTSGGRLVGMLTTSDIARRPIMIDEAGDILHAVSGPCCESVSENRKLFK